jgi:hypothetical protein
VRIEALRLEDVLRYSEACFSGRGTSAPDCRITRVGQAVITFGSMCNCSPSATPPRFDHTAHVQSRCTTMIKRGHDRLSHRLIARRGRLPDVAGTVPAPRRPVLPPLWRSRTASCSACGRLSGLSLPALRAHQAEFRHIDPSLSSATHATSTLSAFGKRSCHPSCCRPTGIGSKDGSPLRSCQSGSSYLRSGRHSDRARRPERFHPEW